MSGGHEPLEVCTLRQQGLERDITAIKEAIQGIDRAIRGSNGNPGLVTVVHEQGLRIGTLEQAPVVVRDALLNRLDQLERHLVRAEESIPGPGWLNQRTLPWVVLLAALVIIAGLTGVSLDWPG